MTSATTRPFWQTVVLTLIASATTGVTAYYAARDDGTGTAQQAVRVDMAWAGCLRLHDAQEARLVALEQRARRGGTVARPAPQPGTEGADMAEDSAPKDTLVGDPPPPTAPTPAPTPKRNPKRLRIPTPAPDSPAVQHHQRALAR